MERAVQDDPTPAKSVLSALPRPHRELKQGASSTPHPVAGQWQRPNSRRLARWFQMCSSLAR